MSECKGSSDGKADATNLINFRAGWPSYDLMPFDILQNATNELFSWHNRTKYHSPHGQEMYNSCKYGDPQGHQEMRMRLAKFLSTEYRENVKPDNLFLVAGVSHGIDVIASTFTKPGDAIVVEEPTYFHAANIYRGASSVTILSVPVDKDGMKVNELETLLASKKYRISIVYTIPVFQNPSGVTLTVQRRQHLISLARKYHFVIVADEVYQILYYPPATAPPIHSMMHFDPIPPPATTQLSKNDNNTIDSTKETEEKDSGVVISVSSFSKLLCPGLRFGWIHACPSLLKRIVSRGMFQSGGGINQYVAALVSITMNRGSLASHIARTRTVLRQRALGFTDALHKADTTKLLKFRCPTGGYFFWVQLPSSVNSECLLKHCLTKGVKYLAGPMCSMAGKGRLVHYARFCCAAIMGTNIQRGAQRFVSALKEFMALPSK